MEGIAAAAWTPYARPMEGTRVRRNGLRKFVAWRRLLIREDILLTLLRQERNLLNIYRPTSSKAAQLCFHGARACEAPKSQSRDVSSTARFSFVPSFLAPSERSNARWSANFNYYISIACFRPEFQIAGRSLRITGRGAGPQRTVKVDRIDTLLKER